MLSYRWYVEIDVYEYTPHRMACTKECSFGAECQYVDINVCLYILYIYGLVCSLTQYIFFVSQYGA